MAIAKTVEHTPWGTLVIFSQASAANTEQTCSTDAKQPYKLLAAYARYSAAPTQTGAITTLNSVVGAAYDTPLNTGTANAQTTIYQPTDLIINSGDAIDVLAPAAGGAVTSAVLIYCLVTKG